MQCGKNPNSIRDTSIKLRNSSDDSYLAARTSVTDAPDNKQSPVHTKTPSVAAGADQEHGQTQQVSLQYVPTSIVCSSTSSNAVPRQSGLGEGCTAPANNSETSKTSYLMCQPELGVGGCSQVARACHAGAADPHDVEYALSLCGCEVYEDILNRIVVYTSD